MKIKHHRWTILQTVPLEARNFKTRGPKRNLEGDFQCLNFNYEVGMEDSPKDNLGASPKVELAKIVAKINKLYNQFGCSNMPRSKVAQYRRLKASKHFELEFTCIWIKTFGVYLACELESFFEQLAALRLHIIGSNMHLDGVSLEELMGKF